MNPLTDELVDIRTWEITGSIKNFGPFFSELEAVTFKENVLEGDGRVVECQRKAVKA